MTQSAPAQEGYIPGMCNINQAEIAYRRKWAYGGIGLALIILVGLLAVDVNPFIRLIIFLPLFVGTINALQVKNKFCVSYAASGQHNANEGSTQASEITDSVAHKADKARAKKMNIQALFISVIVTVISVALPA